MSEAQSAATLLGGGITVTSTSEPGVNGTYPILQFFQDRITAVTVYTVVNPGKFPGGGTTFVYPDIKGVSHTFASTVTWQGFATAVADLVAQLALYAAGEGPAPNPVVSIP